jgi:hypothetical protein
MAFMELEYFSGDFSKIVVCNEEFMVPAMYVEPNDDVIETFFGYGVRLSAPGYLDCTEWEVFETEAEAEERGKELLEYD